MAPAAWITDVGAAAANGGAPDSPIGYGGYTFNAASGEYLVRHRSYEPELGRFLQRDPSGYADGMSLYLYASASPWGMLDPMGLQSGEFGEGELVLRNPFSFDPDNVRKYRLEETTVARLGRDLDERRARLASTPDRSREAETMLRVLEGRSVHSYVVTGGRGPFGGAITSAIFSWPYLFPSATDAYGYARIGPSLSRRFYNHPSVKAGITSTEQKLREYINQRIESLSPDERNTPFTVSSTFAANRRVGGYLPLYSLFSLGRGRIWADYECEVLVTDSEVIVAGTVRYRWFDDFKDPFDVGIEIGRPYRIVDVDRVRTYSDKWQQEGGKR